MSSNKKTIAVVGATGAQGGSVVNYLLKNGGFKVRGLTRKVDEPKAKALSAKGVEMVASDLNGSVDDISKAFQGAHGAFLVTQWGNGIDEVVVGKKLVDAAVKAGVRHIIWSTLPNAEKISNGKYTRFPTSLKRPTFRSTSIHFRRSRSPSSLSPTSVPPST